MHSWPGGRSSSGHEARDGCEAWMGLAGAPERAEGRMVATRPSAPLADE